MTEGEVEECLILLKLGQVVETKTKLDYVRVTKKWSKGYVYVLRGLPTPHFSHTILDIRGILLHDTII